MDEQDIECRNEIRLLLAEQKSARDEILVETKNYINSIKYSEFNDIKEVINGKKKVKLTIKEKLYFWFNETKKKILNVL
jgi:hypothetical protein